MLLEADASSGLLTQVLLHQQRLTPPETPVVVRTGRVGVGDCVPPGIQWVEGSASLLQSCPTLFDPVDCSPAGSSVHGILQTRILQWVAIAFSRGSSQPRSPALQMDSLPSEPPGKLIGILKHYNGFTSGVIHQASLIQR